MLKDKIHLMLLFLSPYLPERDTMKLTNNLFFGAGGFSVDDCVHTNESAMRYTIEKLAVPDKIFMFVSSKVKNALMYKDESGDIHNTTHLEHFKSSMNLLYDNIDFNDLIVTEEYKESIFTPEDLNVKNADFNINAADFEAVVNLSGKIKEFSKPYLDARKEVILHVDMTGGFRHASLLMLSVVELLKYSGIKVENIFYANFNNAGHIGRVEDAKRIHNVFQLVAGAEAFVKYGSVKVLSEYFEGIQRSEGLVKLLQSMRDFEEVLKLCRAGMLLEVLKNLKASIEEYKKVHGNSMEERLFRELLDTIEYEYAPVLMDDMIENVIEIIRWCSKKGFLQQALTFYTEWIPIYLVNRGIVTPGNKEIKDKCDKDKKRYESWEKFMVVNFVGQNGTDISASVKKNIKKYYALLKENKLDNAAILLKEIEKVHPEAYKVMMQLGSEIKEYARIQEESQAMKRINDNDLSVTWRLLNALYYENANCMPNDPIYLYWLKRFSKEELLYNRLSGLAGKLMPKVFSVGVEEKPVVTYSSDSYVEGMKKLFKEGLMKTVVAEDEAVKCCITYNEIRALRNDINHANNDIATYSFEKVRCIIDEALNMLVALKPIGEEK